MTASAPIGAGMIAVEATAEQYFGLKHMPGNLPLDKDGKGVWPADQFTFRLIGEGALRERGDAVAEGEAAIEPWSNDKGEQLPTDATPDPEPARKKPKAAAAGDA